MRTSRAITISNRKPRTTIRIANRRDITRCNNWTGKERINASAAPRISSRGTTGAA
jgi:hypothetical protein